MNYRLLITALGFIWLINIGCNDCHKIRCETASGFIQIQFTRNGQNAIFGPDAFISMDSIQYFITEPYASDFPITFNEDSQTVGLPIGGSLEYILQLSNIRTDTFIGTWTVIGMTECCRQYDLTNVQMNDQVICYHCFEIIEMEI